MNCNSSPYIGWQYTHNVSCAAESDAHPNIWPVRLFALSFVYFWWKIGRKYLWAQVKLHDRCLNRCDSDYCSNGHRSGSCPAILRYSGQQRQHFVRSDLARGFFVPPHYIAGAADGRKVKILQTMFIGRPHLLPLTNLVLGLICPPTLSKSTSCVMQYFCRINNVLLALNLLNMSLLFGAPCCWWTGWEYSLVNINVDFQKPQWFEFDV